MTVHLLTIDHFVAGFVTNLKELGYWETNEVVYIGKPVERFESIGVHCIQDKRHVVNFVRDSNARKVVAHFLGPDSVYVFNTMPSEVVASWIFYGGEFFNRGENYFDFLAPEQTRYFHSYYKSLLNYLNLNKQRLSYHLYKATGIKNNFIRAVHRVDTLYHWIEEDWKMVVDKYGTTGLEFMPFYYSTPIPLLESTDIKTYMLIGNSGAFTNNHLYMLEGMSEDFARQFEKIIVPVSYGLAPKYLKILQRSAKRFGDRIVLLKDFMPKEEYFAILNKVRLAAFPTRRSQGGNNIRWAYLHGVDVALHPQNNMTRFYKSHGLKFHVLSKEFMTSNTSFFQRETLDRNSDIIQGTLGPSMRNKSFQRLLES